MEREKLSLCLLGLDPMASLMSKVCIVQLGLSMAEGVPRLVRWTCLMPSCFWRGTVWDRDPRRQGEGELYQ